jgi:hypothetical protein
MSDSQGRHFRNAISFFVVSKKGYNHTNEYEDTGVIHERALFVSFYSQHTAPQQLEIKECAFQTALTAYPLDIAYKTLAHCNTDDFHQ